MVSNCLGNSVNLEKVTESITESRLELRLFVESRHSRYGSMTDGELSQIKSRTICQKIKSAFVMKVYID